MSFDSAHKSRWTIAEVVFGLPFLASFALNWLFPFSLPRGTLRQALIPVGIALIIGGTGFIVAGRHEFARYGQPTDPGQPTSNVIKTGVFVVSRNPLYLGCVLILLGSAFTFNILWSLVALSLSVILCHYILIMPEEQYLTAKFGNDYEIYLASTRKWLGRKRERT